MQPTEVSPAKNERGFAERPDPAEVRRELDLILASTPFRSSKRSHNFLKHVVTKALAGDTDNLKERTLAVEVFGRKADTDLGEDSIVRVGAREVRRRLAQYYVTEGAGDQIQIDLLAGSYIPTYRYHESALKPVVQPQPAPGLKNQTKFLLWPAIAVVIALLLGALWWGFSKNKPEEFETFWAPAFAQQAPVVLALAHPIVYHPTGRVTKLSEERSGPQAIATQRPLNLPPNEVRGSDYVPVFDQYVGFGDTVAASRLSVLFAQHARPVRIRLASRLDFSDLRDSVTVLIGAFTNRWTMELAQGLRYHFAMCSGKPCIVDSSTGAATSRQWALTGKSDNGRSTEDYILICRLPHAQTGGFVTIGAGLTQYGTEEAGRILANPDALAPLLRKVPVGWRTRNLEMVLHSRVVGETSTAPDFVVSHVW